MYIPDGPNSQAWPDSDSHPSLFLVEAERLVQEYMTFNSFVLILVLSTVEITEEMVLDLDSLWL